MDYSQLLFLLFWFLKHIEESFNFKKKNLSPRNLQHKLHSTNSGFIVYWMKYSRKDLASGSKFFDYRTLNILFSVTDRNSFARLSLLFVSPFLIYFIFVSEDGGVLLVVVYLYSIILLSSLFQYIKSVSVCTYIYNILW